MTIDPRPHHRDNEVNAQEMADAVWLAAQIAARSPRRSDSAADHVPTRRIGVSGESDRLSTPRRESADRPRRAAPERDPPAPVPPPVRALIDNADKVPLYAAGPVGRDGVRGAADRGNADEAAVPGAPSLHNRLAFQRALRPLRRWTPTRSVDGIDDEATAHRIAELPRGRQVWVPVPQAAHERWLDVAFVVDGNGSMRIWRRLARELVATLTESGVFRNVSIWVMTADGGLTRYPGDGQTLPPAQLVDPARRRAILVFSDCVGPAWRDGAARRAVARWARSSPVAILQPLPERLWNRTGAPTLAGTLRADVPGASNAQLRFTPFGGRQVPKQQVPVPVLQLDPAWVVRWCRTVGDGTAQTAAVTFVDETGRGRRRRARPPRARPVSAPDAAARVRALRATASPDAFRLAGYIALVRPTLPLMRLVHRAMFDKPKSVDLAEVVLSGLLRLDDAEAGHYTFIDGAVDALLDTVTVGGAHDVVGHVSALVESWAGRVPAAFRGHFPTEDGLYDISLDDLRFALISEAALRRLKVRSPQRPTPSGHQRRPALVLVEATGPDDKLIRTAGVELGGHFVLTAGLGIATGVTVGRESDWAEARIVDADGDVVLLTTSRAADTGGESPARFGRVAFADVPVPDAVVDTWSPESRSAVTVPGTVTPRGPGALSFRPSGDYPSPVVGSPVFHGDLLIGLVADGPEVSVRSTTSFAGLVNRHQVRPETRVVRYPDLLDTAESVRPANPVNVLSGEARAVRLIDRAAERAALLDWARDDGGTRVMVLRGPAGSGKTRLALDLVDTLDARGWLAGMLTPDARDTRHFAELAASAAPSLVVVDRAETRTGTVGALLTNLGRRSAVHSVRVLLVARSAGDWWRSLHQQNSDQPDPSILTVPPRLSHNDRPEPTSTVVLDLATAVARTEPTQPWVAKARTMADRPLSDEPDTVLDLHVDALGQLCAAMGIAGQRRMLGAVAALVQRERSYWDRAAQAMELTASTGAVLRDCVAAMSIFGADTVTDAGVVLSNLSHLRDNTPAWVTRAGRWLHDLYPADSGSYWGPLAPRVVAEAVIAQAVTETPTMLTHLLPAVSDVQARRAILVTSRATIRHPDLADPLADAIAADPTRLGRLLRQMVGVPGTPEPVSLALTVALLGRDLPAWSLVEVIGGIGDLGDMLGQLDRASTERLLLIQRTTADQDSAHLRRLAVVLRHASDLRDRAGDRSGAVDAARELVQILRQMRAGAAVRAAALTRLADRELRAGDPVWAAADARTAVDLCRSTDQQARSVTLCDALDVLVHCLLRTSAGTARPGSAGSYSGQTVTAETTEAAVEQVRLGRALAVEQPVRYSMLLCSAQTTLGAVLLDDGRPEAAAVAFDDAVAGYRALGATGPDMVVREALVRLQRAEATARADRDDEASSADLDTSLRSLRAIVAQDPGRRRHLASALLAAAAVADRIGRDDAQAFAEEARVLLAELIREDPAGHDVGEAHRAASAFVAGARSAAGPSNGQWLIERIREDVRRRPHVTDASREP